MAQTETTHETASKAPTRSVGVQRLVRAPWPADKLPLRLKTPCPICGGGLLLSGVDACEQDDNGDWIASEVTIDCETEPDIDSDEWEEWHNWHYRMPYVDWLQLELRVLKAVQRKFYFAP